MTELQRREPPSVPEGGSEVLLVIEDNEVVLSLVSRTLERLGYTVLSAATPDRARELQASALQPFAGIICDVVLPGATGPALSEELAAGMKPAPAVLFMSGYGKDELVRREALHEDAAFIQKPLSRATLALAVRQALDQRAQRIT